MSTMTFGEAIRLAMTTRMREDPTIILMGEDVGKAGGTYGVSKGMFNEFGGDRVLDTPISESGFTGAGVGAAATGLRPIVELMMNDFFTVAMDPIVNQAAKMRYMLGGAVSIPMVIRTAIGGGRSAGAQHSQCLESWLTHVPGLKVVFPSTPQDAYGLLLSSIDDPDPVVFMEGKLLYATKGEVNDLNPIPLGKGKIVREGTDITIISYGKYVFDSLKAAETLEKDGISAEVIDLRTLYPLDKELIFESIRKTHRAAILTEEVRRGGYGGEISAMIAEEIFNELDAPVVRVGALNTPVPFARVMEDYYLPNADDLVAAIKEQF